MSEKVLIDYLTEIIEKTKGHLDRFILIGGYASLFYHLKMGGTPPIFTTDLDFLMDETSKEDSILKAMLLELGFEVIVSESGEEKFKNPEWIENEGIIFEIEFLIPKLGREGRSIIKNDAGIKPQELRYLDLLIENTWTYELDEGITIQIPHPARYLLQKLLTFNRRTEHYKRENDILYIAGIIDLFSDESKITILTDEIKQINITQRKKWVQKAVNNYKKLFLKESSEGMKILIKNQTTLSIEQIQFQAEFFLEHL
ncbi:hypothetical protein KAU33_05840 [Candidatus Dependentiae bacterium]|nr:hypothetical protein [Candidatus Dependentiae bacterium]